MCVVIVQARERELLHSWIKGQIEELCDWPLRRGRIIGAFRFMTGCSGVRELREEKLSDRHPPPPRHQGARRNFFDQLMKSLRGTWLAFGPRRIFSE